MQRIYAKPFIILLNISGLFIEPLHQTAEHEENKIKISYELKTGKWYCHPREYSFSINAHIVRSDTE